MGKIGAWEIILVLAIVILLFGAKKIPGLMKGIGEGINEFKKASKGETKDSTPPEKKD